MDTENTLLLTTALISSTICLIGALILAERFQREGRSRDAPTAAPTVIINQQVNPQPTNDIPLQPLCVHAPIP